MNLEQPTTLAEALTALALDPSAQCLAGGALVVGAMNAGKTKPGRLVSLRRIAELRSILVEADGSLVIGAMASHVDVERERRLVAGHEVVREAAAQTAHPTIRNMATMGGSVATGDPTADYPCALVASGAEVLIAGPSGLRVISIDDFFLDRFKTALAASEIVTGVRLAPTSARETGAFVKFSRVDGDYATLTVGVRIRWSGNRCEAIRVAIGSFGSTPIRSTEIEATLVGRDLDEDALAAAAKRYVRLGTPQDDIKASAQYRKLILPGLLVRAVDSARTRRQPRHGGLV